MVTIYCVINTRNNKRYIGQSVKGAEVRLKEHLTAALKGSTGCPRFYNAIRKYGADAFVVVAIERVNTDIEADEAEVLWIDYTGTCDPTIGYNTAIGGNNGLRGLHHTQETKDLIKLKSTGRRLTAEQCKARSEKLTGRPVKPTTRSKIGDANRGQKRTPEQRQAQSARQRGTKQTPDVIERRIAPLRGRKRPAEVCEKIRQGNLGKKQPKTQGEGNGSSKLTTTQVVQIKALLKAGTRTTDLMQQFGMSKGAIMNIKRGRSWSHVVVPDTDT